MLLSLKELIGYKVKGRDSGIGRVEQFYFDYMKWIIRYLLVNTSDWLPGKHVLISPASFSGHPVWHSKIFNADLTKEIVKGAPAIDIYKPVSREKEFKLVKYHNWPVYWEVNMQDFIPPIIMPTEEEDSISEKDLADSHLQGTNKVIGFHIHALDGEIGHIEDFIVEDIKWAIRYMVVNTQNWLPENKVLVAPQWARSISWEKSKIYMNHSKEEIKNSPEYDPSEPVNREYEEVLHDYYGRPKYWD
ncbi:MAG: PRC-barrel domain containing protein [bacterium]